MNTIHEPHWSDEIQIPESVAVCPDCQTKLTISPDGWTEAEDGSGMICDSFTSWCETEPDAEQDAEFDAFMDAHPSFVMPYLDRLPIDIKIEAWLKVNYRFVDTKP
jgi:hypothetical protein